MRNYHKYIRFFMAAFLCAIGLTFPTNGQTIFKSQSETLNESNSDGDTFWLYKENKEVTWEVGYNAGSFEITQYLDEKYKLHIKFTGSAYVINSLNSGLDGWPPGDEQHTTLTLYFVGGSSPEKEFKSDIMNTNIYSFYRTVYLHDCNSLSDDYIWDYENLSAQTEYVRVKFQIHCFCCAGNEPPEDDEMLGNMYSTLFESIVFTVDPKPAKLNLSKSSLDFGTTNTLNSFKVKNTGGSLLNWNSEKSDDNWFGYDPTYQNGLAGGAEKTISVTIDRLQIPQDELQFKDHLGDIDITAGDAGSGSVQIKASIVKPAKPQNLTITNGGSQGQNPHLTWNAVSLVYRYKVERKNVTEGTSYVEIASVASNSCTDSAVYMYPVGGDEYAYRVKAVNGAGSSYYSSTVTTEGLIFEAFDSGGPKTFMLDLPKKVQLDNSYPNPGNPGTTIRFQLPEEALVDLKVFNVRGEIVRTLVNEKKPAGYHEVYWDGTNDQGTAVVTGMYIFVMNAGGEVFHKKFSLIK